MPTFSREDIVLYFEESGSGLPFVFSHGLGGSVAQIKELIDGLPNVRLVLFDNRGHGKTSGIGDPARLNFAAMADDVAALLDHLAISTAVVGGVSMGAGISLAFALKYPSRVKGLVLSRPSWLNEPRPPNLAVLAEIAGMIEQLGSERALELFRKSDLFTSWERTAPETAKSLTEMFLEHRDSANLSTYRFIPESMPFQSFDELKTLRMPTLILTNRNDPLHPLTYGQRLAAAIPSAHLREFPSKSESLELHSRGFREHVRDFLNDLCRGAG